MKTSIIIVAGGSGSRMGGEIPKQFRDLQGRPVLVHTIRQFSMTLPDAEIIVVLPSDELGRWEDIALKHNISNTHRICIGGSSRFESVRNGLDVVSRGCDLVLVHDGVRPLVDRDLIMRCIQTAQEYGSAVPVVEVADSFRRVLTDNCSEVVDRDNLRATKTAQEYGSAVPVVEVADSFRRVLTDNCSEVVDRDNLRAVQTPQGFWFDRLKHAYDVGFQERFTDDASVYENSYGSVMLYDGSRSNIKITTETDLLFAEFFLEQGQKLI